MQSFILMSSPRHGTNYFCYTLRSSINSSNFTINYELLSNHPGTISNSLKRLNGDLRKFNIQLSDEEIKYLINIRKTDLKLYTELIFQHFENLAKLQKSKWYGFKVFPGHLKYQYSDPTYTLSVEDLLTKTNNIIFLERSNLEFIFSYLQARATNKFDVTDRNQKIDILELEQNFLDGCSSMEFEVNNLLKMKQETYIELLRVCKKQNKNLLFLNYDEFATSGWSKISSFLNTPIEVSHSPFSKNIYEYENFYKRYPNLKKIAEEFDLKNCSYE